MRPSSLRKQIEEDKLQNFKPFLVVANAGATNTGAVDPLEELADLCEELSLWFHVDAAYGGFFALTEFGKVALKGMERADSITLDPHKGLFLPYGTGAVLMKDGKSLQRAFSTHASYLPAMQTESDLWDFNDMSLELSRDFRGLRVWLPIQLCGLSAFRKEVEKKRAFALGITERIRQLDNVRIVAEPQLSLLAFRLELPNRDLAALNRINRDFLQKINDAKRVYLSGTELDGMFVLRICVLSFRTDQEMMDCAWEDIQKAHQKILEQYSNQPDV